VNEHLFDRQSGPRPDQLRAEVNVVAAQRVDAGITSRALGGALGVPVQSWEPKFGIDRAGLIFSCVCTSIPGFKRNGRESLG
jgi:hypothetical protein